MMRTETDFSTGDTVEHEDAQPVAGASNTAMLAELATLSMQHKAELQVLAMAWTTVDIQATGDVVSKKAALKTDWEDSVAQYKIDRAAILAKYI